MIIWMDMSTAPKDGTRVLLWIEEGGVESNIIEARNNGRFWEIATFYSHGCGCCGLDLDEDDIKAWAAKPERPEFLNESKDYR